MNPTSQPTADKILKLMEVSTFSGLFILGSYARNVTFSSQQTRAFNLIWALFQSNRLKADDKVLILGGGLAGVTAAAAALSKGCRVHLYEALHEELRVQQGNSERYIHPNILKWPGPWKTNRTSFPFLNWTAGMLDDVLGRIQSEWEQVRKRHSTTYHWHYNELVKGLEVTLEGIQVTTQNLSDESTRVSEAFRCVILALGMGYDEKPNPAGTRSYWRNNGLHQAILSPPRKILVSGCGDGGLVEVLRLRVIDFHHKTFTENLLRRPEVTALEDSLAEIEHIVKLEWPKVTYQSKYDALKIPPSL